MSSLILCPTRALLEQWERQLRRFYVGAIGVVGDGSRRIGPVTVMTFESAYRQLDAVGDRFGALVVDEAHHFAGGLRAEALEMCVAPVRLGLTATAPDAGSAGQHRLDELIGPVVCEVAVGDLVGVHLAHLELVRLAVRLEPDEAVAYVHDYRPFAELRGAFARANPEADWPSTIRAIARTATGREAIAAYQRAVALASFPRAKRLLLAALVARHRENRSLIFTASTDDAYDIALEHLVPVLTSETTRRERHALLERYRDGRYKTLVSPRVLNEGVDVPEACVAIIVAGRFGAREHVQRIGRVLRPAPGKVATVYELVTSGTVDDARARARGRRLAAAHSHVHSVVRFAKLRRLLCTYQAAEDGVRICLSGPLSILRETTKYGHALAAFVPAAIATPGWTIDARCRVAGHLAGLRASAADPIASTHVLPKDCDSAVERALARDVRRLGKDWQITRETTAIRVGERVFFPDFTLSRGGERPILVEIVGYYTPEYLTSKLRVLREAGLRRIIVCVDESLTRDRAAFRAGAVLFYRRRVDAAALLAAAGRIAEEGA